MVLEVFCERYLPAIEAEMSALLYAPDPLYSGLFGMLGYHLGWSDERFQPCKLQTGKRIRPVLCLLSCEACGGDWEQALPAGAAVELMHNFTLIHDDIEDGDRMRRGRPTVWSIWGEAQGINAGDALFAISQLAMAQLPKRGVDAATAVAALELFNRTCLDITCGQYLDIGFESRDDVSIAEYLAMIQGKTAQLMSCACLLGALVAAAPREQQEQIRLFGLHIGLAFQMYDDILGIWGDPAVTGKPVGADIAKGKKSLPILYGLARSEELGTLIAKGALSPAEVSRATELIQEAGGREYTEQLALEHHALAIAALDKANLREPATTALRELAHTLIGRKK
ncbi:MAG: polyprenyl synthetase family protein [Anaerolineae bacterium]|nr:polyprenyl synthetase family protein [Anaerolineae bacterium]